MFANEREGRDEILLGMSSLDLSTRRPVGVDADTIANRADDSRGKGRSHAANGLE